MARSARGAAGGRPAARGHLLFLVLIPGAACGATPEAGQQDPANPPARRLVAGPGWVDSILPLEEEVRRFRIRYPEVPEGLAGGASSRDELVRQWVRAVEARDSVALGRLLLTPEEFITFYYPESPYTRPPYRQSPALRWHLMVNSSSQGASRVWQRHAGRPLGVAGYRCDPAPERLGRNRLWPNCRLTLNTPGGQRRIRLFGPILERDGRYKFLTYGSDY